MPIIIKNALKMDYCSVTSSGVGMTTGVVTASKWKIGDTIKVGFIENSACIIFGKSNGANCFKLSYANQKKKTGGKIYCLSFICGYLKTTYEIPKKNLVPTFLKNGSWQLALIIEEPLWNNIEFSKLSVNKIDKQLVGVYQLTGKGGGVLRIGEGRLYDRLNTHLADTRFTPPVVQGIQYLSLTNQEDGKIMEKVLIQRFEDMAGVLPKFQEVRA
jgi:hypothetical protein